MWVNALHTESKAFLLNLTMIPNWVGVAGLRRTRMKFKLTLTNGKGKRGENSIESFAEGFIQENGRKKTKGEPQK